MKSKNVKPTVTSGLLVLFAVLAVGLIAAFVLSLAAIGGGALLNRITSIGLAPASAIFVGIFAILAGGLGCMFLIDELRKISFNLPVSWEGGWYEDDEDLSEGIFSTDRFMKSLGPYPNTPKNHLCPCGSGRKYKRCCINKAVDEVAPVNAEDIPF